MEKTIHKYLNVNTESEFSRFYLDYYPKLFRVASFYLARRSLAEDIVGEVFSSLWERRATLHEIQDLESYLFIMVKRKCLDEKKKIRHKNHQQIDQMDPSIMISFRNPETAYLNHELEEKLQKSILKLPEKCRLVFLLVKEDQMKYKEVAKLLNISQKTVEMHVGNALKALRLDLHAYARPQKEPVSRSLSGIFNSLLLFF